MPTLGKLASPDLKSSAIQQRCCLEVADFPSFSWSLMRFVFLRSGCSVRSFLHMEVSLHVNEMDIFESRHWQRCRKLCDVTLRLPKFFLEYDALQAGVQFLHRFVNIGEVLLAALPYQMSNSLM